MNKSFSLVLLFLLSSFSYAQVVIEETVEISPDKFNSGTQQVQQDSLRRTYYLPCVSGPQPPVPVEFTNSYLEYWFLTYHWGTSSIGWNLPPTCYTWVNGETFNVDFIEGTENIRVTHINSNENVGYHLAGLTWQDQGQYIIHFDQQEPWDSSNVTYQVTSPQHPNFYCRSDGLISGEILN